MSLLAVSSCPIRRSDLESQLMTSQHCVLSQELRDYLHKHRQWLAGLLAGSSSVASQDGYSKQAALLCSLYSALLKCSEFEVGSQMPDRCLRHACDGNK